MNLEDLRALSIFDGLTDEQLTELLEAGEDRQPAQVRAAHQIVAR